MKNFIQSVLILSAALMLTEEVVLYARLGDEIILQSPTESHSQEYVYWLFGHENGLRVAWNNYLSGQGFVEDNDQAANWNPFLELSGSSLVIKEVQPQHFGIFVCKVFVRNVLDKIITYELLQINMAMKPPSPLLHGDPLSLECKAATPQSRRRPEIHWLNPQGVKINQGQVSMPATWQHNGLWTCVVAIDKKENKGTISVAIVDLPPAPLHPQYTSKSSPLTVPFSIPAHISWEQIKAKGIRGVRWDFFPTPGSGGISNVPQRLFSLSLTDPPTWTAHEDRGLTPAPEPTKGSLSLRRSRGREDDSGDYVCSLAFTNGVVLNWTVPVNVLQITSSLGTDLVSGQQLNLTCSLGRPLPSSLRLKWSPPKLSSLPPLTSDRHPAYLTIPEVGTEDGGKWECRLWQNSTLLTSAVIKLKIEPKRSVWLLVTICSATAIVVLLLVLFFILYRRRQRKTRDLRHRLCQCKNPKPKGFYRT